MFTYLVDVRSILDDIGGSVIVDQPLEFAQLVVGDELFVASGPAAVDVTVSNAGEGIVAYGTVSAPVTATCARCLTEFPMTIDGEVEGFYLRPGDTPASDDDEASSVDSDGNVDLGPALLAALVIEAPYAPLHDPDCEGLCAQCGADLNTGDCGCATDTAPDHPFAGLSQMLDSMDEDSGTDDA